MPLKAEIHEKFGDGIMSAVDLTLSVDKERASEGDRERITLSGKFLPYKKW
jgi:cyanate lyase